MLRQSVVVFVCLSLSHAFEQLGSLHMCMHRKKEHRMQGDSTNNNKSNISYTHHGVFCEFYKKLNHVNSAVHE